MEWLAFCEKVDKLLSGYNSRISFEYDDQIISYKIFNHAGSYSLGDYELLRNSCRKFTFEPYAIISDKSYESLLDFPDIDSRRRYTMNYEDKLSSILIQDHDNGLAYSFGKPSKEIIWNLINEYDNRRFFIRYPSAIIERKFDNAEYADLIDVLGIYLRLPLSLHVDANESVNKEKISKGARSLLFSLSYNLGIVFKQLNAGDIFAQRTMISRRRTSNIQDITAPSLAYNQELTEQYYMALASNDPFVQFIGYYHIMEFFYESVYNEDLFLTVQKIIQHPGFSAKRNKDIAKITETIKKRLRQSKDEFQGSEIEALELTIRKYISIDVLADDIDTLNSTLVDYYKSHQISFSNGDTFDLRDSQQEKLAARIAARIYKTRNALVHSKSNDGRVNERGIYKPFKDSQELAIEIPLMKSIAEAIIINSATNI